ncbi:hypothetical protein D0B54_08335 [Solimonas sp. K1W22B-7]|uniref:hypothetical protein n=1 Tax=Solimonas sp. K1W22B-7 TaxID=2303331 RepID=UPI000E33538E|nr:hypothetical protein [Solimonas sp. K1W22B-7]AXQ28686.1 hypothetical protein D0B54_08335 [Solimonas sp. K1W22B-7]
MKLSPTATAATLALLLVAAQPVAVSAADPSGLSRGSELSANGSATIAEGSLAVVQGSADMVVVAVQAVGDGLRVTLQGSAKVGKVVLSVPMAVAGGLSYAAGQTVTVIAEGAGWLIVRAGEVIAFVPNEAGKALLHSRPVRDLGAGT